MTNSPPRFTQQTFVLAPPLPLCCNMSVAKLCKTMLQSHISICLGQPQRQHGVYTVPVIIVIAQASKMLIVIQTMWSTTAPAKVAAATANQVRAAILTPRENKAPWTCLQLSQNPCLPAVSQCQSQNLAQPCSSSFASKAIISVQNLVPVFCLTDYKLHIVADEVVFAADTWTRKIPATIAKDLQLNILLQARPANPMSVTTIHVLPAMVINNGIPCRFRRWLKANRTKRRNARAAPTTIEPFGVTLPTGASGIGCGVGHDVNRGGADGVDRVGVSISRALSYFLNQVWFYCKVVEEPADK